MRKAFSVQSFWVLKSPRGNFLRLHSVGISVVPTATKEEGGIRREGRRRGEERKERKEKGKKRRVRCAAFLSLFAWKGGRSLQLHSRKGREGGHNSNEERERESMTSQPSWPPLRGALKDSSANLMILQRPGLQSAARRRSLDTDPRRSLLLPRLGRNVSEEVTVKVLHFSFHSLLLIRFFPHASQMTELNCHVSSLFFLKEVRFETIHFPNISIFSIER